MTSGPVEREVVHWPFPLLLHLYHETLRDLHTRQQQRMGDPVAELLAALDPETSGNEVPQRSGSAPGRFPEPPTAGSGALASIKKAYELADIFLIEHDWANYLIAFAQNKAREALTGLARTTPNPAPPSFLEADFTDQLRADALVREWAPQLEAHISTRRALNATHVTRAAAARVISAKPSRSVPFLIVQLHDDVRLDWNPAYIELGIARHRAHMESQANLAALASPSFEVDAIMADTIITRLLQKSSMDRVALGIPTCVRSEHVLQKRLKESLATSSADTCRQAVVALDQYYQEQARLPPSIAGPLREIALALRHLPRPTGEDAPSTMDDITRILRATSDPSVAD